jgi:CHAT domain-containing protein/tetratricopeptide (TPR) repeat protein
MKTPNLFLVFVVVFPFLGSAQVSDSHFAAQQFDSLQRASNSFQVVGQFDQAWVANLKAEEIALRVFGELSEQYISTCHQKALILIGKGQKADFEEAKEWLEKAIELLTELFGEEHASHGTLQNDLGILYFRNDEFNEAGKCLNKALEHTERSEGKYNTTSYYIRLNNIAGMYWQLGQYADAKDKFEEALEILAVILKGNLNADYAKVLNNYGNVLRFMGDYENALTALLEAVEVARANMDAKDAELGLLLNNLAEVYENLGQYEKSLPLFLESIENAENSVGKKHQYYVLRANNLGFLYMRLKRYEEAIVLFQEAAEMSEAAMGKANQEYVKCIHNLGAAYLRIGTESEADSLYRTALFTISEKLGEKHPYYANFQLSLANLYKDKKEYELADSLYKEALNTKIRTLGKIHPKTARALQDMAALNRERKLYSKADSLFYEAAVIQQEILGNAARHLPEEMLHKYASTFSDWLNTLYSYCHNRVNVGYISQAAYDASLFHKGFVLHNVRLIRKVVEKDSATFAQYEKYQVYSHLLSQEEKKPAALQQKVLGYREEMEKLERLLTLEAAGFSETARQVVWQEVQSALRPGAAAVEFVHYRYMTPKETYSTMYAALVLLPGAAAPAFIPLCEERELMALVQDGGAGMEDIANVVYRGATGIVIPDEGPQPEKRLYGLLWQPLEELLQGMQTVYYAPSGLLHRINLSAIQTPEAGILGKRHHLIALGSTRQLVPEANIRPETYGQEIALFGGIHFEADTTLTPPPIDSMDIFAGLVLRGAPIDSTHRQSAWGYLTGTAQEVQNIQARLERQGLPVRLYSGHEASEEAFKQLGEVGRLSPRVLHLATHGFFSPDPKAISRNMDGEPVFKWSDNPMIRSGLVLAGGNHAWRHGSPLYPGMEDGILTAQEISQMNLRNTELVVLSACETGLGDIEGNEGVYGLQRAFKIAGAQYLIMSLWKVPDAETAQFMEAFYGHWLEEGWSIPDAFRMTQEELRERYKEEPYRWAGFVLVE